MATRSVWLLVTTVAVLTSRFCDARSVRRCPARCVSCDDGKAQCSRRSLVTPPKDFAPDTRTIVMDNNYLRVLGARSFQRLDQLEVLRLKGNKVRVVKKSAFAKMPSLMTLDLSSNKLVKIYSKGFLGLGQLRTLSLQQNHIRSLSRILDHTPRLYQLNLAFNNLRALGRHDLKTPTHVHYLDLRNNKISKIHPTAFSHLKSLRYLFLNNNPLVKLPDLTLVSTVLQLLDFDNCRLTHVPRVMPTSVSDFRLNNNKIMMINDTDFKNMTKLRILALNSNKLHFVGNRALMGLTGLQEVWLRNNRLGYVPRGLPDSLRKLHMDSNNIQVIEEGLFSNRSRLDYLTVENNKVNHINNQTFAGLAFLKTLNFRRNRLRVIEAGTFRSLGNLTKLSLSDNPLERIEDGAFGALHNLSHLHLDMCGESTALDQPHFLQETPALRHLTLMNSPGLGKAFLAMLADDPPARPSETLTEMDLTYNDLDVMTANVRQVFPNLTALSLDGNPWLCDRRLAWLGEWMAEESSGVTFNKYEPVVCERPYALKGKEVGSLGPADFAEVAPVVQAPSQQEYRSMLESQAEQEHQPDDNMADLVPSAMNDSPLAAAPTAPTTTTVPPPASTQRPRRQRKQRPRNKKRVQKTKGKKRQRRGKKGKGRKRRNKAKRDAAQ